MPTTRSRAQNWLNILVDNLYTDNLNVTTGVSLPENTIVYSEMAIKIIVADNDVQPRTDNVITIAHGLDVTPSIVLAEVENDGYEVVQVYNITSTTYNIRVAKIAADGSRTAVGTTVWLRIRRLIVYTSP